MVADDGHDRCAGTAGVVEVGEAVPEAGWVDPGLREEFGGLGLRYLLIDRGSGRSPREVKESLRELGDRIAGPQAISVSIASQSFFISRSPGTARAAAARCRARGARAPHRSKASACGR